MIVDEERAVFAVVGDPAGDRYIQAPTNHDAMTAMVSAADQAGELFFCSSRLGGCGEKVMPVNGNIRIPHFRHYAHTRCPLTPALNRDIYTHAIIQDALVCWLRSHGHPEARTEKRLDRRSRVDVHCDPDAVIEVQLSGETDTSMLARTLRYGNNVTWLYDPFNAISSREATLTRDGTVLVVRFRPSPDKALWQPQTGFNRQPIDIGVKVRTFGTEGGFVEWHPLEACTFTPVTGLEPPLYAETRQTVADARERKRQAQELARIAAAQRWRQSDERRRESEAANAHQLQVAQAEGARRRATTAADDAVAEQRRLAAKAARDALWASQEPQRQAAAKAEQEHLERVREASEQRLASAKSDAAVRTARLRDRETPVARSSWYPTVWNLDDLAGWEIRHQLKAPENGPWWRVLAHHDEPFAEWVGLVTDGWATSLPEHLVDPAWAALYLTTLSLSGKVSAFIGGGDQDNDPLIPYDPIDPDGIILDRLQQLGLISLYGGPPAPLMVNVEHHLGHLRWDPTIPQPPVWAAATL
jgi:pyruvate/2-oxoglutarate dehydrogenase complex dihydrolipoamide acyltransferase (E2) component